MALADTEWNGNQQVGALLFANDGSGNIVPVKVVSDGTYGSIAVAVSGAGAQKMAKVELAVVAGTPRDFLITQDIDLAALPTSMEIRGVIVVPHDGAATPVAVSTKWRLRMYSHSDRLIDEIMYDADKTGQPVSSSADINNTYWAFKNEEGSTEIPCTIEIPGGEGLNNATFTIRVLFN